MNWRIWSVQRRTWDGSISRIPDPGIHATRYRRRQQWPNSSVGQISILCFHCSKESTCSGRVMSEVDKHHLDRYYGPGYSDQGPSGSPQTQVPTPRHEGPDSVRPHNGQVLEPDLGQTGRIATKLVRWNLPASLLPSSRRPGRGLLRSVGKIPACDLSLFSAPSRLSAPFRRPPVVRPASDPLEARPGSLPATPPRCKPWFPNIGRELDGSPPSLWVARQVVGFVPRPVGWLLPGSHTQKNGVEQAR